MGNILSTAPTRQQDAEHSISESETMNNTNVYHDGGEPDNIEQDVDTTINEAEARAKAKEEEMEQFRTQLAKKREQRKEILARHRSEKEELERSLRTERSAKLELFESNKLLCELLTNNNIEIPDTCLPFKGNCELADALSQMRDEFEILKANNLRLRKDLAETNKALQDAYSDIVDLNGQNTESIKQIHALKEVVTVSKTMISLREQQLNDLKDKLNEIERTLADRETNLLSADLRQEYERQLQNIRTLRGLYEERARLAEVSRQGLVRELDEHKGLYQVEVKKCKDLNTKVRELEDKIDSLMETIDNKNSQISSCQIETNVLKAEMSVVNKLFSQVLLGYKTKQDLDTLVQRLEENHGLLTQMAEKENGSEASSALPKLLLELVSQVDDENEKKYTNDTATDENPESNLNVPATEGQLSEQKSHNTTAEEIVENLPKVWKVLMELLSHQNAPEEDASEKVTTCYKSVETKSGPVLVPSVSQTYIRLKDLIIEKLGLIKEVNHMKQLNTHLETRLEEQERRLCLVTNELSKTWHVVGRLRRHHHQLHTHEKILKYELQQKRKLLNELKEELEYCREKWEQAREKNTQSEKDWRNLRAEFSNRKVKSGSPSINNSGESGYSDERPSDESSESNDESEYVAEPLIRCKKKLKKSFETILDSSTDFNLAAEREDPVSDMLDVADLPLDTQESDGNHDLTSELSKSEYFSKNAKVCEETEDEVGDITHDDSCHEETNLEDISTSQSGDINVNETDTNRMSPSNLLAKKDQRQQCCNTVEPDSSIISYIDKDTNQPTTSYQCSEDSVSKDVASASKIDIANVTKSENNTNELNEDKVSEVPTTDFKTILANIRKQNERLAKKDERLQSLENSCSEVVKNITSTLNTGDKIIEKLDTLHSGHTGNNKEEKTEQNARENIVETEDCSPSTSNDIDHEARFAARDLRLKRLEEQTKSLVNRVNKTTSKGVKINYKLEELHNIYGSESSRAGTPSEENEDKSNDNDSHEE